MRQSPALCCTGLVHYRGGGAGGSAAVRCGAQLLTPVQSTARPAVLERTLARTQVARSSPVSHTTTCRHPPPLAATRGLSCPAPARMLAGVTRIELQTNTRGNVTITKNVPTNPTVPSQFHVYFPWVNACLAYCLKCGSASRRFQP